MTPEERKALIEEFSQMIDERLPDIVRHEVNKVATQDRFLRQDEAAKYVKVCRKTLYNLQDEGFVPFSYLKPGVHRVVDKKIIDQLFFKNLNDPRQLIKKK